MKTQYSDEKFTIGQPSEKLCARQIHAMIRQGAPNLKTDVRRKICKKVETAADAGDHGDYADTKPGSLVLACQG